MTTRSPSAKVGLILCLLANSLTSNSALIVSPPPPRPVTGNVASPKPNIGVSTGKDSETKVNIARIRSTRRSDVDPVADLLSTAITGNSEDTKNWKARVERLRVKSSIRNTLDLRVRAMEEGKKHLTQSVAASAKGAVSSLEENDPDYLQQLWSNDSFRRNIQQAAELSSEPHPWENHNFALAPKDPCWLRHEMISAQDITTGEIIGFCEIAMLLCPSLSSPPEDDSSIDFQYGDDHEDEDVTEFCTLECAPTIANLVVSPTWRRRGVAKGLIKTAERIVARKWQCDELGLYVEKTNKSAMDLYARSGYEVTSSSKEQDSGSSKWYMSKPIL